MRSPQVLGLLWGCLLFAAQSSSPQTGAQAQGPASGSPDAARHFSNVQMADLELLRQQAERAQKNAKSKRDRAAAQKAAQRAAEQLELLAAQPHIFIVGGTPASAVQFPYDVALLINHGLPTASSQYCAGTLISPQWVLTAAHCAPCATMDTTTLKVYAGSTSLVTPGETIAVVPPLRCHESYNSSTLDYDIALMKLETPVSGAAPVLLPDLATEAQLRAARQPKGIVTGWGRTSAGSVGSNDLLYGPVPVLSDSVCQQDYPGIVSDAMLCAGDTEHDTCDGDSGGPLLMQAAAGSPMYQVGITSWGAEAYVYSCAQQGKPGVYTRVAYYAQWIRDHMK